MVNVEGYVFGAYCPKKWENFNGKTVDVKDGFCFMYYFDNSEIIICPSKKQKKNKICSDANYPYYINDNNDKLRIGFNENDSYAALAIQGKFILPNQVNLVQNKSGNYFLAGNHWVFKQENFELYGLDYS